MVKKTQHDLMTQGSDKPCGPITGFTDVQTCVWENVKIKLIKSLIVVSDSHSIEFIVWGGVYTIHNGC